MSTTADIIPQIPQAKLSARGVALIVASAMFMEQLDSTVITTALPAMAKTFGANPAYMSITLTSYLLSLAMFIPASGQVADRLGATLVFRLAIVVFTLSSILCAVAPTLDILVLARFVQGIGGAMMVPVGRLILLRSVDKSERIAAMAWLLMPAMVGPVLGPPVGGLIVTYASWRWIFAINIPIGILGIILVTIFIKDVGQTLQNRIDLRGLILSGAAILFFVVGLEMMTGRGNSPVVTAITLSIAVLAGALYYRHTKRHTNPILDLQLMRVPTFFNAVVAGTLFRVGFAAMPFLLPLMLQLGFGVSAAKSGLITFASAASSMMMKSITVKLLRLFGYRTTLIWNSLCCMVFLAICAAFRPSWPEYMIYIVLITGGIFRSLQFSAYGSIAYADISQQRMSAATSFYSTVQQLSATLGISVSAVILATAVKMSNHTQPRLADFSIVFIAMSLLSLPALFLCLRLPLNAGSELTGSRASR